MNLVQISSEQVLTTTIVIEDDELRREVLQFLLGVDDVDVVIDNAEQFGFSGGQFRTIIPSDASDLSTEAHEVIYDISGHPTYWQTDRFVYQVQLENEDE